MKITKVNVAGENLNRLVDRLRYDYGREYKYTDGNFNVFIIEEFYFRISSYLTTTIIVNLINDENCCIEIISSGGGNGVIGFTWGAEGKSIKALIKLIKNLCKDHSWSYEVV